MTPLRQRFIEDLSVTQPLAQAVEAYVYRISKKLARFY